MGIFSKDQPVVEEFDTVEDAVVSNDEQEVTEVAEVQEDLGAVEQKNKEYAEALTGDGPSGGTFVENPERLEEETQQEYNERVPVAVQPVLAGPTTSYLGKDL